MVDDKSIKQSIRVYYYYYHYYLNFNNDNNYERKKNVTKTNTNGGARDRMMIDLIIMYNFSKECVIDEVTTEFFLFLNHRISDAILIFIITKCVKTFFFLKFFLLLLKLLLLLFFYISFWIFFYPPTIMNCFFLPSPSPSFLLSSHLPLLVFRFQFIFFVLFRVGGRRGEGKLKN